MQESYPKYGPIDGVYVIAPKGKKVVEVAGKTVKTGNASDHNFVAMSCSIT